MLWTTHHHSTTTMSDVVASFMPPPSASEMRLDEFLKMLAHTFTHPSNSMHYQYMDAVYAQMTAAHLPLIVDDPDSPEHLAKIGNTFNTTVENRANLAAQFPRQSGKTQAMVNFMTALALTCDLKDHPIAIYTVSLHRASEMLKRLYNLIGWVEKDTVVLASRTKLGLANGNLVVTPSALMMVNPAAIFCEEYQFLSDTRWATVLGMCEAPPSRPMLTLMSSHNAERDGSDPHYDPANTRFLTFAREETNADELTTVPLQEDMDIISA